jgi:L-fuconolactonase
VSRAPRADAHVHLFRMGFAGETGSSPAGADEVEAYERLRLHHAIERSLVLGYEGDRRYVGNSEDVLSLAQRHPWIAPLVYLRHAPAPTPSALRDYAERGAVGFALYADDCRQGRALVEWPDAALAELRRQRAVISINAEPETLAAMGRFIDRLEGCAVVVSHLGSPPRGSAAPGVARARELLAPLLRLASRSHVRVKFSGLYAISDPAHDFPHASAKPFVDVVLERFGPSRLVWGSDFPPALDYVSFAQLLDTRLLSGCSPADIDGVMGTNLLGLLDA